MNTPSQETPKLTQEISGPLPPFSPPYGWYPPHYPPYPIEEEVNLLDYWRVLRRHLGKIFLLTLLCTGLVLGFSLKMTKKYKAEASIMPLSQSSGGGLASLTSQINSIPLVGGQLGGLGNSKSGQLVNILKSRTLSEKIIHQFGLMYIFFEKRWDPEKKVWRKDKYGNIPVLEDAVGLMKKKIVNVEEDKKTGLIKITVELKNSQLAAEIANRFLAELQDFINHNDLTVAKRNRVFIEEQLQKNKIDLLEFGKKLNQFYSNNRISSVQPQLDVSIGKIEDQPKAFEEFRGDLSKIEQQQQEISSRLNETERSGVVHGVPSQVYLQYLTLQRELLGRINGLLTQQYQLAKIEEAKEDLSFQVIDKAVPPVHPSKPQVLLNTAIAFTGSLFLSIFLAFFLDYIQKMKKSDSPKVTL